MLYVDDSRVDYTCIIKITNFDFIYVISIMKEENSSKKMTIEYLRKNNYKIEKMVESMTLVHGFVPR